MEIDYNTGDRLEVSLVHRKRLANTASIFFADVEGAGTAKGRRFLRLKHEDGVKEAVFMDEYFLMTIVWKPEAMAPLDRVSIDSNQESQSEGYEVICHILEQAGIKEEFELEERPEMKGTRRGPKRIEVTLVHRRNPQNKITIAVVEYLAPKGPFKYHTIKGRQWIEATKRLESTVQTYNTDTWWVSQVVKYISPGSSTSSFHSMNDMQVWKRIGDFYDKMQPSELNVVRHWKYHHDGTDEYPAVQRHHHGHPSHYGNPYKPATVFFRVAGDEVGQKAYLVQAEKQVQGESPDPPTLEEFLEDAEKKSTAGDVSDSADTSSAVSGSGSAPAGGSEGDRDVGGSGDPAAASTDGSSDPLTSHDPELDPMEDDTAFAFGALPYVPGIHDSAIERCLRRFPGALGLDLHLDPSTGKRRKRVLH